VRVRVGLLLCIGWLSLVRFQVVQVNAHSLRAKTSGHIVLQKSTNVQVEVFTDVEDFSPICSNSRH